MNKKSLVVFLAVLLLASWLVQGLAIWIVGDLNSERAMPWLISMMFFPTIATLVYRFGFNRAALRHVRFRPGNPLFLVLAALIPAATALAVLGLMEAMGWGRSDYFRFSAAVVEVAKGPWVLGLGSQSWVTFAVNVALTAILYALINSITAVGEEFAWRGFLQGQMIAQFGTLGGVALLGLVWAFWHLPSNLAGYNYTQTPVLGALVLFPILLVCESFIMAWLTIRAGSFWPAVLMHGSTNGIQEGILSHVTLAEHVSRLRLDIMTLVVSAALGAACAWLLVRRRSTESNKRTQINS